MLAISGSANMYVPSLFLIALIAAFLNTAEAMNVETFLGKHNDLKKAVKSKLDEEFAKGKVYRGETLELILAIIFSVDKNTKAYTELPASDAHHVRSTNNGMITPEQVRAEIKTFIKEVIGTSKGHEAALKAVVVANVAVQECESFLNNVLGPKVTTKKDGQGQHDKHEQAHIDELTGHFKATLLHHETPELADAAAHFRDSEDPIPEEPTPNPRKTPGGEITKAIDYRTEIRKALEASTDLNGIAHAALEKAHSELSFAKQRVEEYNAAFTSQ